MKTYIFYLILILFSSNTFAQKWIINEDHSELFFSVQYLKISEVTGRFQQFTGNLKFDDLNGPKDLMIAIQVGSIETGNKLRDGHLKGNDFLQKSRYPEIIFESSNLRKIINKNYVAHGILTIRGVSKPLTIEFSLSDPVLDTWNYVSRFAKFKAFIRRSDFDISWNKTLTKNQYLLGDDINFWGTFQIQPMNEKTPDNKHLIPDTSYIRERERINRGEVINHSIKTDLVLKAPEKSLPHEEMKAPEVKTQLEKVESKTTLWWTAFFVLGFMGFISVILISIYSKNFISDFLPTQYKENSYIDYLSDVILIGWVLLYSVALWIIGWVH
jgi:polyisoprenoid-binding protein YceI